MKLSAVAVCPWSPFKHF